MFCCDFGIPEFEEILEGITHKMKLYAEVADGLSKAEFAKTPHQIIIYFLMCCLLSNAL